MRIALLTLLAATAAHAGDLEDGEAMNESKAHFDEGLKSMNDKCGTHIAATYELRSERYERERFDGANKKWIYEPNRTEGQFRLKKGYGYELCACAFKGIERNCDKDTFKAMIAEKVKSISCEHKYLNKFETELLASYEKDRTVPPGYMMWEVDGQRDSIRHEYKDGVLKTFIDPDTSNCGDYTAKFVRRNLGFDDQEGLVAAKERFEEALKTMNQKCSTSITASYDLKTEKYERERFDAANKKWNYEPNPTGGQWRLKPGYGYDLCTCAFTGIQRGCEKDTYKAMIAKKVKSISCEHKHLTKLERELAEAYEKTRKAPPGYDKWEVDVQRDNIRHEYKGGVLKTFIDADTANCGEYTQKFVNKKL